MPEFSLHDKLESRSTPVAPLCLLVLPSAADLGLKINNWIRDFRMSDHNQYRDAAVYKGYYKDDYRNLKAYVSSFGVSIPPLVNSYMNLSPKMQYFGTGLNDEFGDVLDSGIMIPFKYIAEDKIRRHIDTVKPGILPRTRYAAT